MSANLFIAGDWGTSNLRLYLCEYHVSSPPLILDSRSGLGVSQVQDNFENTFFSLTGDWLAQRGPLPIIISGMAGSTIGWREAAYLSCPADVAGLAQGCLGFEARGLTISIVPGLRVTNPLGAPDVMRGEELQLLGWLKNHHAEGESAQLFALPGTHNKWALLRNGCIETFVTALTGELFALLQGHSVLIGDRGEKRFSEDVFLQGVEAIERLGDAQLIHALFATRSRQVLGELAPQDAASYLSGLLIGADVLGALALFRKIEPKLASVNLIGEQRLSKSYQLVLERLGVQANSNDATQIAVAGYAAIYHYLHP